ncbi:MAG: hypothetical protein ACKO23_13680 [Gemmataceae bacterium]
MKRMLLSVSMIFILAGAVIASDETVPFTVFGPYFERNDSGLKGSESHLVIGDAKKFGATFGFGFVMGARPDLVPDNHFTAGNLVVAAIKRGTMVFTYKVEKVTLADGKLTVRYQATGRDGGGTASFASPMVVGVPKKNVSEVVFVENGKKVATVKVGS